MSAPFTRNLQGPSPSRRSTGRWIRCPSARSVHGGYIRCRLAVARPPLTGACQVPRLGGDELGRQTFLRIGSTISEMPSFSNRSHTASIPTRIFN